MRNQKISDHLSYGDKASRKRRYSESAHRTFNNFKESCKKEKIDSNSSIMKNIEIEDGSDFIKGKKMNIHQVP